MYTFKPIGVLNTCFKEKFGIPRQPRLVADATGILKLNDDPFLKIALRELDGFSHIWVVFVFNQPNAKSWKPSIRPPRLGGARKVGVLASRSPHRPNPIGLSAVRLVRMDVEAKGGPVLYLEGVDILDDTPVLDIKPYLPYADSIPDANAGWAEEPIERVEAVFSAEALNGIETRSREKYPRLKELIQQMLELDPRPAFQKRRMSVSNPESEGLRFGFRLFEYNINWEIRAGRFLVLDIVDL